MAQTFDRIVRVVESCDLTRLPIGAREGFVLSRLAEPTTISDLVAVTGFSAEEIDQIVAHLEQLGAVSSSPAPPRTPAAPPVRLDAPRGVQASPSPSVTRMQETRAPMQAPTPTRATSATSATSATHAANATSTTTSKLPALRADAGPPIVRAPAHAPIARPPAASTTSSPRHVAVRANPSGAGHPAARSSASSPNYVAVRPGQELTPRPASTSGTRPAVDPMAEENQLRAATLLAQAREAEEITNWAAAADAYLQLREACPDDPMIAERAANALRRNGHELHRAVRLAEEAVQKGPKRAQSRLTLALCYVDAKLFRRACSELEEASRLSPDDVRIRKLLEQVRRLVK